MVAIENIVEGVAVDTALEESLQREERRRELELSVADLAEHLELEKSYCEEVLLPDPASDALSSSKIQELLRSRLDRLNDELGGLTSVRRLDNGESVDELVLLYVASKCDDGASMLLYNAHFGFTSVAVPLPFSAAVLRDVTKRDLLLSNGLDIPVYFLDNETSVPTEKVLANFLDDVRIDYLRSLEKDDCQKAARQYREARREPGTSVALYAPSLDSCAPIDGLLLDVPAERV